MTCLRAMRGSDARLASRSEDRSAATMGLGLHLRARANKSSRRTFLMTSAESLCDLARLMALEPEGSSQAGVAPPLMRFSAPPATSPPYAGSSEEQPSIRDLSQVHDGLHIR